jgi:hypothetical protein
MQANRKAGALMTNITLSTEFWIQIVIYAVSFGTVFGTFRTRLNYMEKKLDKHNNFAERVIALEQSTKSAHHRLDRLDKIADSEDKEE